MRKPIRVTNKELKKIFLDLNKSFFYGRLDKNTKVHFSDIETGDERETLNGLYEPGEIILDSSLKIAGMDYIVIILLHEMAHADTAGDDNHGPLFSAKIVDLFTKGAYNGLL